MWVASFEIVWNSRRNACEIFFSGEKTPKVSILSHCCLWVRIKEISFMIFLYGMFKIRNPDCKDAEVSLKAVSMWIRKVS